MKFLNIMFFMILITSCNSDVESEGLKDETDNLPNIEAEAEASTELTRMTKDKMKHVLAQYVLFSCQDNSKITVSLPNEKALEIAGCYIESSSHQARKDTGIKSASDALYMKCVTTRGVTCRKNFRDLTGDIDYVYLIEKGGKYRASGFGVNRIILVVSPDIKEKVYIQVSGHSRAYYPSGFFSGVEIKCESYSLASCLEVN